METTLIFIGLAIIITIPFIIARRCELKCPKCGSRKCNKTGNRKKIERKRRGFIAGPLPHYDYEYKCSKCGHVYWSTIESILGE